MADAKRDSNRIPTLIGVDHVSFDIPTLVGVNTSTHAVLVEIVAGGAGDGAILDGVTNTIKATVFDYANSNPLGVVLRDTNGDYVSVGGGTQYTEDAAAAANPVGNALIVVREDARAGSLTTTDGDNVALRGNNLGELYVKHTDSIAVTGTFWQATQPVSGTVTANAGTNLNTSALALETGGNLASIKAKTDNIPSLGQALAASSVPVVLTAAQMTTLTPLSTVAVTQSGTWDEVGINDSGNSITVDNNGTFAVQADTELTTDDLDTGAGTDTRAVVGLVGSKSGGGELIPGSATDGLLVNLGTNNDVVVSATNLDIRDLTSASDSVEVKQATGTNLHVVVDTAPTTAVTGTFWQATQPVSLASVPSHAVTNAGTFATQATLQTGSAAIGKLAANSGVDIGDVDVTSIAAGTNKIGDVDVAPRTTGGWSVGNFTSGDSYTALTATAQVIKGSAGKFGGYYIYNPNAAATYVEIYNIAAASVTVGTSTAKLVFCIPASSAANLEILAGIPFDTAMSIAATTTGGGNTAPTTALEAMVFYV